MPTPEEKKAAEKDAINKQRESIKVETVSQQEKEEEEQQEEQQEEKEEKEKEEKEEKEEESEKEEKEESIEAKEDEIDELEKEKKGKSQREKERIQRRIDKLTADKKALKDENARLQALLDAKPDDEKVLTEDEVERRAEAKAEQKRIAKEFENNCNKLATEAAKVDKKFQVKVDAMAEEIGAIPGAMIGILADFENGGAVLSYLTNNIDEAEEIYELKHNPARMALKLNKISDKLLKTNKKEISKAPAPKEPVGGGGDTPEQKASEKDDMDTWVKKRNIEAENHRRRKLGLAPLH